jgi:hypothetical protein
VICHVFPKRALHGNNSQSILTCPGSSTSLDYPSRVGCGAAFYLPLRTLYLYKKG